MCIVHIVQIALKSSNSHSKSICEEVTTLTDKTAKDKALTLVRCELNNLGMSPPWRRVLTCIMLVPRWILHQGEWKHWLARDRVMNRWSGCQVSTPSLWIESHLPCTKALFHVVFMVHTLLKTMIIRKKRKKLYVIFTSSIYPLAPPTGQTDTWQGRFVLTHFPQWGPNLKI